MNQSTVTTGRVRQLTLPPSDRVLTLAQAADVLARPPGDLMALLQQQWDRVRAGGQRRPWDLVLPVDASLHHPRWRERDLLLWSWRTGWHPVGMTARYGYRGPVIGYVGLALLFDCSEQWLRKLAARPEGGLPAPVVRLRVGASDHTLYDPHTCAVFGRQSRRLPPDAPDVPPWPVPATT